jgi:hypothetical protein
VSFASSVPAKAIELTKLAIEITTTAGSGHPTSAASLARLATVLMYSDMRYNPAQPDDDAADRLVLSERHACPIVYAAAADLGIAVGREHRRAMTRENDGRVLTLEDNYGAGIGSAVADALLERGGSYSLKQMYVRRIPKSGRTPDDLLRDLELSDKDIVKNAESMLGVATH